VSRLQRDGHLDAKAAKELNKRLDETFEALAEGRDDKAWDKLRETAEKVTNLRDEGKLTPAGYDVLAPQLTQLAAALHRR
jgi:hypothetical protein